VEIQASSQPAELALLESTTFATWTWDASSADAAWLRSLARKKRSRLAAASELRGLAASSEGGIARSPLWSGRNVTPFRDQNDPRHPLPIMHSNDSELLRRQRAQPLLEYGCAFPCVFEAMGLCVVVNRLVVWERYWMH
jgi:hypothetical protein